MPWAILWTTLCTVCLASDTGSGLVVDINNDGSYRLVVNDAPWLASGYTFFNNNRNQYSTFDKSLKLVTTARSSGKDNFGLWVSTEFNYQAGSLPVRTSIKVYVKPQLPLVIFSQKYLDTATKTADEKTDNVISSFPSFKTFTNRNVDLGYLAYGGYMVGYSKMSMGRWKSDSSFATGVEGGPLVIFDNSTNALVISPLSQFMAASNQFSKTKQEISYGIMGPVDNVPSNYSIDFIVYYSDKGINQAMQGWGQFLKTFYQKDLYHRISGISLNYLGYWTDNVFLVYLKFLIFFMCDIQCPGAYYYYNTETNKNYETTILDVVNYIKDQKIPFRYTQYDSWWYQKGHITGALSWTPRTDLIPDGFKYLSDQTGLPFACHNKFWDNQTLYAKFNGGHYNFISDTTTGMAYPEDDQFWLDIFNMTQQWGPFIMYEQDWMSQQTDHCHAMLSDVSFGRRWLISMGKGAEAYGNIGIQYCTASSRHILQSLEIFTVSQARASTDYSPGGKQWDIGITSMFADAVGLAPSKDTFWTTEVQPGSPYGEKQENKTKLNSVITTLSTGPVGPGDGIGYIDLTVLMRCCDSFGKILQPSKPATAVDDQIKKKAFSSYPGPDGEVYTTFSNISGLIFGIVLAADLSNSYDLTPSSGWTFGQLPTSVVYSGTDPTKLPVPFSESAPLSLGPSCSDVNFCLYYTSPVLQLGNGTKIVLLGEPDKWVPLSSKRFSSIQSKSGDVTVILGVNAHETVTFNFLIDIEPIQTIICDNSQGPSSAYASRISIARRSCTLV
ncbi:unnamed protein product [Lymnaea stagnalis]|uniref:Uncharacterized protein n=1 Tax=Lymnaea stagnalis TaxID=6523 RepID=A0AAV2IPS0_LYMST